MADWFESSSITAELQEEFASRWMLAGGPKDAAIFAAYDSSTKGMTCYINPAMAKLFPDLVTAAKAIPCDPQFGYPLLVGDQQIIEERD